MKRAFGEGCSRALDRGGLRGMLAYAVRGFMDVVREGLGERVTGRKAPGPNRRRPTRRTLDSFLQDLRFGFRSLRRRPVFTGVTVTTLALGIGSASAIFSVVNGVLLKPFPYPDPGELVALWNTNPQRGQDEFRMGAPDVFEVERSVDAFSGVAMVAGASSNLTGDDVPPLRVDGAQVSDGFFRILGIQPLQGRVFRREEHEGDHGVVILSHGLWMSRFGGDPGLVGRTITMDGLPVQVVGVMPPVALPLGGSTLRLSGPESSVFWTPLDYTVDWVAEIGAHVMAVVARMEPGLDLAQAREEVSAVAQALVSQGRAPSGQGILVRPLKDQVVGDVRRNLVVLMTAVGLLLLLACGTVANLLLARSKERERELSVRSALGARQGRLVGQILTETMLLAFMGGSLGLILARWGSMAMVGRLPTHLPRQSEIGVDGTVLLFTLAAVLAASLLAVLIPALRLRGREAVQGLKAGGRGGTGGPARNRANRVIVMAQLSMATILLFGAGLLFRSLHTLEAVDPGFAKEGVVTAQIVLPEARYGGAGEVINFYDEVRDRVRSLPGVTAVALAMDHPLENTWWNGIRLMDSPPPDPDQSPTAIFRPVSDGYFSTMGIPVVEGRSFTDLDRFDGHPVMVVNQAFARHFFPDRRALGERVEFSVGPRIWGEQAPTVFEVVGIVGDVRFNGLREPSEPAFYLPLSQFPYGAVHVLARTSGDPAGSARALEEAIWTVDPDLPVTEIRTMEQLFSDEVAQDRFNVLLLEAFALAALVLAAAGIYGVLNLAVSQRRAEIGIRMALGAEGSSVVAMIVKEAAMLGAAGLGVGLGAALLLSRFLGSLLFQIPAHDSLVIAVVTVTVSLVALGSGIVPALSAARTDPVRAMKTE
jgi:predicted permease